LNPGELDVERAEGGVVFAEVLLYLGGREEALALEAGNVVPLEVE